MVRGVRVGLGRSDRAGTALVVGGRANVFEGRGANLLQELHERCHRPGEIAPMSLLTFKEARPWARSIATQVSKGAMPPWHADPAHGQFLNDRSLSDHDKQTIVAWAETGALEGNPADLPAQPVYTSEWQIGQPDAVFSMAEDYPIPAEATTSPTSISRFRRLLLKTSGFRRWRYALEIRACCTT